MEDQDITNFSNPPSSHRLPTISASDALRNAASRSRSIPTGLPTLDLALQPNNSITSTGGLPCGSVAEIYGPPGVGKTAFAIQAAVNALHASNPRHGVVWIDTGAPLSGPRFKQIFAAYTPPESHSPPSFESAPELAESLLDNVSYFNVPTLAHLLVLFLHPTSKFPPPRTSLIVVDNVSTLFATAFPRSVDSRTPGSSFAESARNATQQRAANRKWAVAGDLAAAMAKMATLHHIAVLVVNQVAMSLKDMRKAVLKPSLSGNGWDAGVGNRVLLYRDFAPSGLGMELSDQERRGMRFAEVVKVGGKSGTGAIVPFVTEDGGLREIRVARSPEAMPRVLPAAEEADKTLKRKADEIADSQDDEDEVDSEGDWEVPDEFLVDSYEPDLEYPG